MAGYDDREEDRNDTPAWLLYSALVGAGLVLGLLVGQIASVL